ncbi:MAG TPA: hypothetical protein VM901_05770 [Bdellovibrionota bacterium]|jgi:hypothetical protein|nr:hypothetical protein [Bdellovibrionota bacterium]
MRQGWGLWLAMVLVVFLGAPANASTNGIKTRKRGIVRLQSQNPFYTAICTSAVVGVRPLVLLTAFHCLGDVETGAATAFIEEEEKDLERSPAQYRSTRVVLPAQVRELEAFRSVDSVIADYKRDSSSAADPHMAASALRRHYARYNYARDQLNRVVSQFQASDLALLVFDNYDGFLNHRHVEDLVARGALVPIARRAAEEGDRVAFGGFGEAAGVSPSDKQMHGFTNYVQKSENGFVATYGMVPEIFRDASDTPSLVSPGEMGAILPGDSGGPLMSDYGVVGVASWYKRVPMESDEEIAFGWPRQPDGYYLYMTSRYSSLHSDFATNMLETAAAEQKLSLVFSDREIPQLHDVPKWEGVGAPLTSRTAKLLQDAERYHRQYNPAVNPIE